MGESTLLKSACFLHSSFKKSGTKIISIAYVAEITVLNTSSKDRPWAWCLLWLAKQDEVEISEEIADWEYT